MSDDKTFMSRVSARMVQAGYDERDAMRVVHAEMLREERAAVVKYLRTMSESPVFSHRAQGALRHAAEDIERGEHVGS